MANEFDVLATNGQGNVTLWQCKQCLIQISATTKPRGHICVIPARQWPPPPPIPPHVPPPHVPPPHGPSPQAVPLPFPENLLAPRTPVSPATETNSGEDLQRRNTPQPLHG